MAPTTISSNLARRAAASRADVAAAAAADSQDNLARSAPTLAETLQTSHIRWLLQAGWAQRLATTDERFGHWLADGRATLVKHGTNRLVYRVDRGDEPLYVKRYRHRRGLARLAPLWRGSPARREWNKALELSRRGIPTAMPVALGEDLRAGIPSDSLLVTREIPASQSLDQFLLDELPRWTATEQRATRRWLACSLARLVAATHRAGVRHDDLHAGNILVNLAAARRLETPRRANIDEAVTDDAATDALFTPLFLIDLPGVSFGRPLGRRASLTSLVMLAAGLFEHSTSREQWRCWRTYLASRPDFSLENPRAVAQSIVARVLTYQRALARSRDRRALATNRDFQRIETSRAVCYATQELLPSTLQAVLRVSASSSAGIEPTSGATAGDFAAPATENTCPTRSEGELSSSRQPPRQPRSDQQNSANECAQPRDIADLTPTHQEPPRTLAAPRASVDVQPSPSSEKVSGTFSSSTDGRPSHAEEKVPDTFSPASFDTASRTPQLVAHRVTAARWPWNWLEHPARRAWRLAQALASRGIATERPLASLVPRWFAPWRDGYLVFASTVPAMPLAELLASLQSGDSRDARRLAETCGAALGRLHRWRVKCPTLSIGSFAVRRKSDAFEILLNDWAPAQLPRWSTPGQAERRALRDLAALRGELRTDTPVSRTWLARALRAYVAVQLREPAAWRELWRQLAE